MKKTTLKFSIALASCSFFYSLSTFAENTPNIPFLKPGFDLSIGPVWLQPGASNLNYVINNKELPAQTPTWTEQEIQPTYTVGFELEMHYIFNNDKDIRLDWTRLVSNTSESFNAASASYFLGPDYEIGPDAIPIRSAEGKAKFNYNVINLDAGLYVRYSDNVFVRYFGGLSAGFLHEEVDALYSGTTLTGTPGPFYTQQEVKSNFNGVGPMFGVHANYYIARGFGVLGEIAVSALIGSMHSVSDYFSSSPLLIATYGGPLVNPQFIKDQSVMQVIPGMSTKLGIDYTYPTNKGLLTISAGYEAAVYINAISQYIPGSVVTPTDTGGIYVATMDHTLSNYSVQGPFLNVAFNF